MNELILLKFLQSFFALFHAKIEDYDIEDGEIIGTLGFDDCDDEEDKQDFSLEIENEESDLVKMKLLCDFLLKNDLIHGDKINRFYVKYSG